MTERLGAPGPRNRTGEEKELLHRRTEYKERNGRKPKKLVCQPRILRSRLRSAIGSGEREGIQAS